MIDVKESNNDLHIYLYIIIYLFYIIIYILIITMKNI
jgi:hypothetical protein